MFWLEKKKWKPPRRDPPVEVGRLLQMLNEVPTEDRRETFLDRYCEATAGGDFNQRMKDLGYERLAEVIGQSDREHAKERLADLEADKHRLRALIWAFEKRIKTNPVWPLAAIGTTIHFGSAPISRIGFDINGNLTLPQSNVLPVLMGQNIPAVLILDRLAVCPVCQKIRWLKKEGRSDTCGEQSCRDRLAYVRSKKRDGKPLDVAETELIDQAGPGSTYRPRGKKKRKVSK